MNLISRSRARHIRDKGKTRAEQGVKTASDKLNKVAAEKMDEAESRLRAAESLLGKKANGLQDEALELFNKLASKRIDDLESRLEELKGQLPQSKRKKRGSFMGKLFMFSIFFSGAVATAALIKSKMSDREDESPFETSYEGSNGRHAANQGRGPRSVGGHLDNNDIADDRGERPSGNSADPRPESRSQTSATSPNDPAAARLNEPLGKDVVDIKGESIGQVERIYYRRPTWEPEWAGVASGLADKKTYLVPLSDSVPGQPIKVAYSKEQVEAAPQPQRDGVVGEETEMQAYKHYNLRRELPEALPSVTSDELRLYSWPLLPNALAS